MTRTPTGSGLVGRVLATSFWTFYGSREYAAAHGLPTRYDAMQGHVIVAAATRCPGSSIEPG